MNTDIIRFFEKIPEALPLYAAVEIIISKMGNVNIKLQKSQIVFTTKRTFAFIWLPIHKMKKRPEIYIILSFGLDHKIQSPKIEESVEPYPNRWTHHIIIEKESDIDYEIIDWLWQAYKYSLR